MTASQSTPNPQPVGGNDLPDIEGATLWHCHFWDGPLNGVCLVGDRICWFATPDDPTGEERTFYLYEMTDDEVRKAVTSHFLFEHYVGTHTCRHDTLDGNRHQGHLHDKERWRLFYDAEHPEYDPTEGREPFGTFVRVDHLGRVQMWDQKGTPPGETVWVSPVVHESEGQS